MYGYSYHGDLYKNSGFKIEQTQKSNPIKVYYTARFEEDDSRTLVYSSCNDSVMAQEGRKLM